jgi:hypothetical protein
MNTAKQEEQAETQSSGWAPNVERINVADSPEGAFAANLDDRKVMSPQQGFGRLWQRTYRVRLAGCTLSAAEVMATWKKDFPHFQPKENHFHPTQAGVAPGAMIYIDSSLMPGPAVSAMTEVESGVLIIYADDVSFTVMTPEGFPVSGWNTFSVYEDDGVLVAQVQGLERANDPIYEFGYRFLGGEKQQDKTWSHVLRSLAEYHGVQAEVELKKELIDPRLQWANAGNVWQNAAIRTLLFNMNAPVRWLRRRVSPQSTTTDNETPGN